MLNLKDLTETQKEVLNNAGLLEWYDGKAFPVIPRWQPSITAAHQQRSEEILTLVTEARTCVITKTIYETEQFFGDDDSLGSSTTSRIVVKWAPEWLPTIESLQVEIDGALYPDGTPTTSASLAEKLARKEQAPVEKAFYEEARQQWLATAEAAAGGPLGGAEAARAAKVPAALAARAAKLAAEKAALEAAKPLAKEWATAITITHDCKGERSLVSRMENAIVVFQVKTLEEAIAHGISKYYLVPKKNPKKIILKGR
jgi:hypothetical protein